jgi:hypothetical protein
VRTRAPRPRAAVDIRPAHKGDAHTHATTHVADDGAAHGYYGNGGAGGRSVGRGGHAQHRVAPPALFKHAVATASMGYRSLRASRMVHPEALPCRLGRPHSLVLQPTTSAELHRSRQHGPICHPDHTIFASLVRGLGPPQSAYW